MRRSFVFFLVAAATMSAALLGSSRSGGAQTDDDGWPTDPNEGVWPTSRPAYSHPEYYLTDEIRLTGGEVLKARILEEDEVTVKVKVEGVGIVMIPRYRIIQIARGGKVSPTPIPVATPVPTSTPDPSRIYYPRMGPLENPNEPLVAPGANPFGDEPVAMGLPMPDPPEGFTAFKDDNAGMAVVYPADWLLTNVREITGTQSIFGIGTVKKSAGFYSDPTGYLSGEVVVTIANLGPLDVGETPLDGLDADGAGLVSALLGLLSEGSVTKSLSPGKIGGMQAASVEVAGKAADGGELVGLVVKLASDDGILVAVTAVYPAEQAEAHRATLQVIMENLIVAAPAPIVAAPVASAPPAPEPEPMDEVDAEPDVEAATGASGEDAPEAAPAISPNPFG